MTDLWVVNASPLIVLAKAARLNLLEEITSELLVPPAVVSETLAGRQS